MNPAKTRLALLLLLLAIPALIGFASSSLAQDRPSDEVRVAIEYAAKEWGVSEAQMVKVARCESSWRADAVGGRGKYLGLFQHSKRYWPGRVREFNRHAQQAGLPTMNGDWPAAIDAARVTARMVKAEGWRQW